MHPRLWMRLAALALLAGGVSAAAAPMAGRPLAEALLELQARGLRVIYSDSLVRPEMVVVQEPADRPSLPDVLEEILAPFRLTARTGPQGTWLVVPRSEAGAETRAPAREAEPARCVFPSRVDWVDLRALVTRQGQPVRGLRAADFDVRDNGVPQHVEVLADDEDADVPVRVVLALDHSDSVNGPALDALKAAAARFLDALSPRDSVSLVAFATSVEQTPDARASRDRVRTDVRALDGGGTTVLYDAVYVALQRATAPPARSILVVLSDGEDTGSWLSARDVLDFARRSDVMIYGLERRRRPGRSAFLHELAQATGGAVWGLEREDDLASLLARAVQQARWAYRLRFEPRGVPRDGIHDVAVRLTNGGASVQARRTYALPADVAPPEAPGEADTAELVAPLAPTRFSSSVESPAWPFGDATAWGPGGDPPLCRNRTQPPLRDEYRDLLGLYRSGHEAEATARLSGCAASALSRVLDETLRDFSHAPTAVALHTEAALRLAATDREGATQLALVESRVLERLPRIDAAHHAQQAVFWRRWLLALGQYHQGRGELGPATRLYTRCTETFRDEPLGWIAAGTIDEMAAADDPDTANAHEDAAEKRYRTALALDPASEEAHVRLARVLQTRGRDEEARVHLQWVTDHGRDPLLVGIAWLSRGALAQRAGGREEALHAYRAAHEVCPDLQPALIGWSYVAELSGFRGQAQEVLAALPDPGSSPALGPWREYNRGLARAYASTLAQWYDAWNGLRKVSGS